MIAAELFLFFLFYFFLLFEMMKGVVRFLRLHCRVTICTRTGFGFVQSALTNLIVMPCARIYLSRTDTKPPYIHTYTRIFARGRHTAESGLCASPSLLHETKLKVTKEANGWRALLIS